MADVKLLAPIPCPGKLFALAGNYADHIMESTSKKLQGTKLSRAPETIKAQALPVAAGPIGQTAEAFSSAMRADEGELTVGDLISVRREVAELENSRLAGKAMDDRACVAIVTLALEHLTGMQHAWDVFAVATVQEEIGVKGAFAATYGIAPDVGIALDVTFGDQPSVTEIDAASLGEGPVINIGPNFHPALAARLKKVAETHEIPLQIQPAPSAIRTERLRLKHL